MKHILAFAGSSSSESINKKLATYAANLIENMKVTVLDLNDFDLPIYTKDLEAKNGIPENAKKFLKLIKESDGLIISLAEHNGAYAAVFKNLFDWMTRAEQKTFMGKPILLMATSPGSRGGASVLAIANDRFPRHDAHIVAEFSLPFFNDNFSEGKITDLEFDSKLKDVVELFRKEI